MRPPDEIEKQMVLAWMEEKYAGLPRAPDDWFTRERFEEMLLELDTTSTPGIPYMRDASTIGQWLKADGLGNFDSQRVNQLWYDVNQLYAGEWNHVFRVFVKNEPHKLAKKLDSRWRLIMCASLANQMLWKMCLKHQNDWLNSNPYKTPSGHGLVYCYGGWKRFKAHAKTLSLDYSRDLTSWDLSSPGWVWQITRDLRIRAGGPSDWERTMMKLYRDAFDDTVLRFSNGYTVRKMFSGMMESGLYITISDNSLAMIAMHYLASLRSGQKVGNVWATGDDVLQQYMSDAYLDELEALGCRVKEWHKKLEFMGTDFTTEPVPVYLSKHIVAYLTKPDDITEELLDAYARLWVHSPRWFEFWRAVSVQAGINLRSRDYYRFWYDSPFARIFRMG